jgi:putative polyhydroxyalkanoate system protein
MSVIEVTRNHHLSHDDAIAAATQLAETLSEKYDVRYTWQGDILRFKRAGVQGQLEVEPDKVHLRMELGLLMRPFYGRIERSIHQHMDKLVG